MSKANISNPKVKALGMVGGIITTGIIGGSAIANKISHLVIDPIFKCKNQNKKLYAERHPEGIDMALHIDDVATVGIVSGLKWIEPALPLLYTVSGFRAGIGYRNGKEQQCKYKNLNFQNAQLFKDFYKS